MWPYSEVIRMILLGTVCLPVEGINFDRNFFGVEFIPFVKDIDENGYFTPKYNYTFQNVRTMLEVVSTKFSRIMTYGVDAPDVPYVKNDTYYKSTVRTRTAEAAALINCERRNKTFTVFIGYYQPSSVRNPWSDTQLYVAVEAAEIANLIYPGTVEGIFLVGFNRVGATDPLLWNKKLRGMTKDLGLKVGKVIKGEEEKYTGSKLFWKWNINVQEVASCDFIVYSHPPQLEDIEIGTDFSFFKISNKFRRFHMAITEINNKTKVMWHTYWPIKYDGSGYTRSLLGFWDQVNKFGMEEKFSVFLRSPFNIHSFIGTDIGWWKLTQNDLIDSVSGYEENISGKPVQVNYETDSLQCFKKEEEATSMYPAVYNFSSPKENDNLPEAITRSSQSITHASSSSETPTLSPSSVLQPEKEVENGETFSSVFDDDFNITLNDSDDLNSSTTPKTLLILYDRNEDGQSLNYDFQKTAIIIGGICIVIAILGLASYIIFVRRKLNLLKAGAETELNEAKYVHRKSSNKSDPENALEVQPNSPLDLPENMPFELPKKHFDILWDEQLGTGQFGLVYKAILQNASGRSQDVALKLPKPDCIPTAIQGLISEIKVLTYLGQHQNIVSICGAYTAEVSNGVVYLALQLCPQGSLRKHLKSLRKTDKTLYDCSVPSTSTSNCNNPNDTRIPLIDLLSWSYEIACGMEYLEEKKVVHADLATRNVLLTADKTAKITDFGLSRCLDEDMAYTNASKGSLLPWRWMALESLETGQFSVKTDVWSYGVTLWEISSLGDLPFPLRAYDEAFITALKNGLRLRTPKFSPNDLYEIMTACWDVDPDKRPSFRNLRAQIKFLIDKTINSDSNYIYSEVLK